MELNLATPLIALVEDDPHRAMPLVPVLECAGYRVAWYRQPEHLLDDVMDVCPDIVILASRQPQRYDRWHIAAELHTMGCAVIMATASSTAMREVYATPRGRYFVGIVYVPYDVQSVLATVARALAAYPANMQSETRQSAAYHTFAKGVRHSLRTG